MWTRAQTSDSPVTQDRPDSPGPTCVSLKSDHSKLQIVTFKDGKRTGKETPLQDKRPDSRDSSCLSFSGALPPAQSKDEPTQIFRFESHQEKSGPASTPPSRDQKTTLDSVFDLLEEKIVTFVKSELRELKEDLRPESPQAPEGREDKVEGSKEAERRHANRDSFLKITLSFLRQMEQDQLADSLQSQSLAVVCQRNLRSNLRKRFQCLFEGVAKAGEPTFLNQIYTELSISRACSGEVKDLQESGEADASVVQSAVTWEQALGPLLGPDGAVRTLLTKGVAGIGKTVLTRKFILDWAEGRASHGIQLIFPFTFRELNLMKEKRCSLVELLHRFFIETKEADICRFEDFRVLFIFDGLDECRLHLDFRSCEVVTDATERVPVEVLLTNLITGTLLPTARLWMTTRPAAASQIPPEFIDMVVEVRGFGEPQKLEYFSKKVKNRELARRIISHIETSRSLHVMCRIPVFCWISAEVLAHVLKTNEKSTFPQTLTDMYLHFLVVQTKRANEKYRTSALEDALWSNETKKTIFTLGKLAFDHLEKQSIVFDESELETRGIDTKSALIYSGLLTDMDDDAAALKQERLFCFVHLSIQEFLAALYVLLTFINNGGDLLRKKHFPPELCTPLQYKINLKQLFQKAIDKALHCQNGHLDLFVRFLLGLSLDANQLVLRGLLKKTGSTSQVKNDLVKYIKKKLGECPTPERSIFLFECLNELNDQSLEEEIQQYISPGRIFENKLSPAQWSAVAFILLSSQWQLNIFDLKMFCASDEGLLRLRPVVKASKRALLSDSNLSSRSCQALVPVLSSANCSLMELDLSNNDLRDEGVTLLLVGLTSPCCRLDTLRLSGCQLGEKGCENLALALQSNPAHLRELDLSFNHPGGPTLELLSAAVRDPRWRLEKLNIDHCGRSRLRPSPLRFFCQFSLDPNTTATTLLLSENNRRATLAKAEQPYPDRPERCSSGTCVVLCTEGVTARCYWEVKWDGRVDIGVAYRGMRESREEHECRLGRTARSWGLLCSAQGYAAWHNGRRTDITQALPGASRRVGVYTDWAAGTVSFYLLPSPPSGTRAHLHTFRSTFTEPLFPAFGFERTCDFGTDSSFPTSAVHLSQVDD